MKQLMLITMKCFNDPINSPAIVTVTETLGMVQSSFVAVWVSDLVQIFPHTKKWLTRKTCHPTLNG